MGLSSKGYSLLEVSIAVTVAGILAAVAIPNYNRYINKSKQTEAKANLMALYSAEKTFFFNQQFYCPRLDAVGFKPVGTLAYRVGFAADSAGTPAGVGTVNCINTASACPGATWNESLTATAVGALTGASVVRDPTPDQFQAEARALLNGVADDVWNITNANGTPLNTTPGL